MREQAAQEEAEHQAEAEKAQAGAAGAAQGGRSRGGGAGRGGPEGRRSAGGRRARRRSSRWQKKAAAKLAAQKKLAEERKLAEEKKLAAQQAAAERAARVADLQQSLQEDQRATVASGALASWTSEITSRIQNAWIRPPTAQPGIKCVLNVGLVPGGSVTSVSIGDCNGDDAVRQSIQTAVYNAAPLPPPPDGIPFPRQLIITFQPTN